MEISETLINHISWRRIPIWAVMRRDNLTRCGSPLYLIETFPIRRFSLETAVLSIRQTTWDSISTWDTCWCLDDKRTRWRSTSPIHFLNSRCGIESGVLVYRQRNFAFIKRWFSVLLGFILHDILIKCNLFTLINTDRDVSVWSTSAIFIEVWFCLLFTVRWRKTTIFISQPLTDAM